MKGKVQVFSSPELREDYHQNRKSEYRLLAICAAACFLISLTAKFLVDDKFGFWAGLVLSLIFLTIMLSKFINTRRKYSDLRY